MTKWTVAMVMVLVAACGSKGDKTSTEPPVDRNWWCNWQSCERTLAKCIERGQSTKLDEDSAACRPYDTALCATLKNAQHGDFEMCFADMEACQRMIETTDALFEIEVSKTRDPTPADKFRRPSADDLFRRCKDKR